MIGYPPLTVAIFITTVIALLALDLYCHRKDAVVSVASATKWSLFYVVIALAFAGYLGNTYGSETASLFLTGYALEKVLAFDNLFVFSLIFTYFKIPAAQQHKALYWGIGGAIVFRLIFVAIGASFLSMFGSVVEVVFAIIILYTVWLMYKAGDDDDTDYNNTWYVKVIRKIYPAASPFVLAVVAIEISDILFSFDSVPAIIAVTKEPLLIYSAMIFAILGLRTLYHLVSALTRYFEYMDEAVMLVLVFISIKLLLGALTPIHIDPVVSLATIVAILFMAAVLTMVRRRDEA